MTLLLRGYHGEPKLVRVCTSLPVAEETLHETLFVGGGRAELLLGGFSIALDERDTRLIENLHDGDIASLNERGLLYKLFDAGDDDATIYMTGRCNSNCIMCPESDNQRQYDEGLEPCRMMEFLDMLPTNLSHFVVTGGEPTLETGLFFAVMERLKEQFNESEVLLLTNGRSFAAKSMIERLDECQPSHLTIAIPIHGHTAALHDSISRAGGSFHQTCLGIRNLKEMGTTIELRVVVSRINYLHLDEIAAFIVREHPYADIVNFVGLEVMGNCAKYLDEVYIDYAEAFPYVKPAIERLLAAGIDAALYNYPLCSVDRGFWPICRRSISPYKVRYADACEGCDAKAQCGGIFSSTLSAAKPILTPIHL